MIIIQDAFESYDRDGSGEIDAKEFTAMLRSLDAELDDVASRFRGKRETNPARKNSQRHTYIARARRFDRPYPTRVPPTVADAMDALDGDKSGTIGKNEFFGWCESRGSFRMGAEQ